MQLTVVVGHRRQLVWFSRKSYGFLINWLAYRQTILTDIYDLKGEKITRQLHFSKRSLLLYRKKISAIFGVDRIPVCIAEAQTALLSMRAVRASHPSCIARSQTVLLSMRAVRAFYSRMHF